MQKKVFGILAGVAAAHAVLIVGLMAGGGCRQPEILGPHTYDNGVSLTPAAVPAPAEKPTQPTTVPGGELPVAPETQPTPPPPPPVVDNPPPAPIEKPQAVRAGGTYIVKKGDSLSKIAYMHGVRMMDLAAANNLSGAAMNRLRIGQKLEIPAGGTYNAKRAAKMTAKRKAAKKAAKKAPRKTAPLPADGVYTVVKGDSLDRIGRRFGVKAAAIAKENNISLNKVLHIGDKLRIPGKAAAPSSVDTPAQTAPAVDTPTNVNVDDLDPELNTTAPAADTTAAPAADANAASAANAAPAADTNAAPATPATPAAPAAPAADAQLKTEAYEVAQDMTVANFCKLLNIKEDVLRRLNPDLPADGNLKGGTYLIVPVQ